MSPNASTTNNNDYDTTTAINNNNNNNNNNRNLQVLVGYGSINISESSSTTISTETETETETNNIGILVTAFLAALASGGPTYAFGLYSQQLKSMLNLTQGQINTLSSSTFCAGLLSWIPGMVVDQFGSRLSMIIGGIIESIALVTYYVVATMFANNNHTTSTSTISVVPILSFIGIIIFMSNSLVIGSLFKMIVQTSSNQMKGKAVGAAKGYLGLGAGVYSVLFDCLQLPNNNTLMFLPMSAILCIVAIVIPAIFLVPSKDVLCQHLVVEAASSKHFRIIYIGLLVLAMLVLMTSFKSLMEEIDVVEATTTTSTTMSTTKVLIANNDDDDNGAASRLVRAVWVLMAWFIPIFALFTVSPSPSSSSSNEKYIITDSNSNAVDDVVVVVGDDDDDTTNDDDENNIVMTSISPSSSNKNKDTTKTNSYSFPKRIDYNTGEYSSSTNANNIMENDNNIISFYDNEEGGCDYYQNIDDDDNNFEINESKQFFLQPQSSNNINSNNTNDYTLLQMLQTTTAWCFCWTCVIIVGSGTIMTNNMGQMVESLGFAPRTASASLAFFSVAQALARVGVGTISDAAAMMDCSNSATSSGSRWKNNNNKDCCKLFGNGAGIPRPAFLVVSTLIGMIAHAILASAGTSNDATSLKVFVVGVVCSGIAFGMIWPLMVLIVGEVFGTKNHGANYMFYDGITSAMGTLLISNFLASAVYERNINSSNGVDVQQQQFTCYGRDCFGWSHVIIVVLLTTCLATGIAVWRQTVNTYRKQYIGTPRMQRIRSNDELYGSPYRTWRKRDALRYS